MTSSYFKDHNHLKDEHDIEADRRKASEKDWNDSLYESEDDLIGRLNEF